MRDDTKDSSPQSPQAPINDQPDVRADRRRLLKALAGTGSVLAAGGIAPESWKRPVVKAILLPVHAQTSCGGGQGYAASVILNVTSGTGGVFDLVVGSAYAQAAPTSATAEICIFCNGDGTLRVAVLVAVTEVDVCTVYVAFEHDQVPVGQYLDLVLQNICPDSAATIRINSVGDNVLGELNVQNGPIGLAGGFSAGPGSCPFNAYPAECACLGP